MTLIIALASNDVAVLIADRRVSQGNTVLEDEYNKVTVLCCLDARMAIALTGLATWEGFDASEWIASNLHQCGSDQHYLHNLLESLRLRLQRQFREFPARVDRRLSVVFCGYVYYSPQVATPAAYVLSNFEHGQNDPTSFSLRSVSADDHGIVVEAAGDVTHLDARYRGRLQQMLLNNPPAANIVRFSVSHIRNAARATQLTSIGEQCNAIVIPSAVDTQITTTYHTNKNSTQAWSANVVFVPGFLAMGIRVQSGRLMTGPDIPKRSPCWCGSGLMYKDCHMRKFGAIQITHPLWSRPLPVTVRQYPENPSALSNVQEASMAGNHWCVTSSYE